MPELLMSHHLLIGKENRGIRKVYETLLVFQQEAPCLNRLGCGEWMPLLIPVEPQLGHSIEGIGRPA